MSKQETDASSYAHKNTSGSSVSNELYADGEKYLSRKGGDNTASSYIVHKYISSDRDACVSTTSSRSQDRLSEINSRLKKIAR